MKRPPLPSHLRVRRLVGSQFYVAHSRGGGSWLGGGGPGALASAERLLCSDEAGRRRSKCSRESKNGVRDRMAGVWRARAWRSDLKRESHRRGKGRGFWSFGARLVTDVLRSCFEGVEWRAHVIGLLVLHEPQVLIGIQAFVLPEALPKAGEGGYPVRRCCVALGGRGRLARADFLTGMLEVCPVFGRRPC